MADPIQHVALKAALSLPRPLLRLLSGGAVVYCGGRTLDPRFQFLAHHGRGLPALDKVTPQEARLISVQMIRGLDGRPEPGVSLENLTIETEAGPLKARAYRPTDQDPAAPVLVYAHMGGGVIGNLDTCHQFCGILAAVAKTPVLSVDYRLAPEDRFPAGLDDTLAAYRWARSNAGRFGAPAGVASIGGDAIGGNFAAVICLELRRHGEPQPALQLMIYPAVDVASETQSMTTYADAYPLSRDLMAWFMGHYLGPGDDPADPRLSPIKAADLSGLAPAVIATAGFDPLVDQGEAYAKRLGAAGTPVAYRCYDALAHGFCAFTSLVPAAEIACREIAGLVREATLGETALMRALMVEKLAPDYAGCVIREFPTPDPQPGEVLVEVRAAAVNFPDLLQTRGEYQHKPALPFIPGLELAGVVAKVGEGESRWKVGDEVAGGARLGGYSDMAICFAQGLRAKPPAFSFGQAAGFGAAYLTAYVSLVRRAEAQPGEWVLVHGAAGGVGLACVDLAKVLGCRVIAASASDAKLQVIADEYAPDATVNVTGGFRERVKALTGGRGADVVYDPVGGDVFDESVRCIAFNGRLLVVGFTSGRIPTVSVNMPLIKGFSVMGVRAGEYGRQFPERGRENAAAIWNLAAEGKLKPRVYREYALDDWRSAFDSLADRQVIGKSVIVP